MTRILMDGYYGHGNFGDDLLMHLTYRLLRQKFPDATLTIVTTQPSQSYIPTLLDGIVLAAPDRHAHYDLIVHGGGGVFFDFASYGLARRLGEMAVRGIGFPAFLALEAAARRLTGKSLPTTKRRVGLGIGVGRFSAGSPRMLKALPVLASFDHLWLRDRESNTNLQDFAPILRADLLEGSDLAFLTEYWLPEHVARTKAAKPRLGVALRDWRGTDIHAMRNLLMKLARHYDITGFIFDAASDPLTRHMLGDLPLCSWDPHRMQLAAFARQLAAQDALLTSRAHGAICGACLGVPSVILDIEPKMQQVHDMLPVSSILVQDHAAIPPAIDRALHISPESIMNDVTRNHHASQTAWHHLAEQL